MNREKLLNILKIEMTKDHWDCRDFECEKIMYKYNCYTGRDKLLVKIILPNIDDCEFNKKLYNVIRLYLDYENNYNDRRQMERFLITLENKYNDREDTVIPSCNEWLFDKIEKD